MLEQEPLPYWKHYFTGVPAPGGCWMVLTPYILMYSLGVEARWPAVYRVFSHPVFGMAMLLFVGALMASRLPTISLKSLHISKRAQRPVIALGLFLIGCLFANLWLTLGVIGALYIITVPVTGIVFMRGKARYEAANAQGAQNVENAK